MSEKRQLIAAQNDQFRQNLGIGPIPGTVVLTAGMMTLEQTQRNTIIQAVIQFDEFTPDNDPYGEHDFGIIRHAEAGSVYWKIDYYEPSLQHGSEDPSDLTQTHRVLTIMLASEY